MKIKISLTDDKGNQYSGESTLFKVKQSKNKSTSAKISTKSKRKSLGTSIQGLIGEGFFNSPRNLKEISEKLKANAVFYPKTSYPDALIRLIKNKKLRRLKDKNQWTYVKYG